jgi:hypothetical protein
VSQLVGSCLETQRLETLPVGLNADDVNGQLPSLFRGERAAWLCAQHKPVHMRFGAARARATQWTVHTPYKLCAPHRRRLYRTASADACGVGRHVARRARRKRTRCSLAVPGTSGVSCGARHKRRGASDGARTGTYRRRARRSVSSASRAERAPASRRLAEWHARDAQELAHAMHATQGSSSAALRRVTVGRGAHRKRRRTYESAAPASVRASAPVVRLGCWGFRVHAYVSRVPVGKNDGSGGGRTRCSSSRESTARSARQSLLVNLPANAPGTHTHTAVGVKGVTGPGRGSRSSAVQYEGRRSVDRAALCGRDAETRGAAREAGRCGGGAEWEAAPPSIPSFTCCCW